jgi:hypothetical protein
MAVRAQAVYSSVLQVRQTLLTGLAMHSCCPLRYGTSVSMALALISSLRLPSARFLSLTSVQLSLSKFGS